MPDRQLDRIGIGLNKNLHSFREVFDAAQKVQFIKKSMVDRNIDTTFGSRIKQAIEAKNFHREERGTCRRVGVLAFVSL